MTENMVSTSMRHSLRSVMKALRKRTRIELNSYMLNRMSECAVAKQVCLHKELHIQPANIFCM